MIELDTPYDLRKKFSLSDKHQTFISSSQETVKNILNGKDPRFLVLVGPCSIHDIQGALEFAERLKVLQKKCPSLFLVMRTYFEKARTSYGWKGLLYDPYLNGTNQISEGLKIIRKFLVSLSELEIPAACEFIDPTFHHYIGDLITWSCVGARTTASQVHRQMASGLNMPVGFKNTPEGNIEPAIHGILSSSREHSFLCLNSLGNISVQHTLGNDCAHLVLRGGEKGPNYFPEPLNNAIDLLKKANLPQRLIVDCSHDNSAKKHELQSSAFHSVLHQFLEGNYAIRGAMLESYLLSGNQSLNNPLKYGVSITDACISWEETEALLLLANQEIIKEESQLRCVSL